MVFLKNNIKLSFVHFKFKGRDIIGSKAHSIHNTIDCYYIHKEILKLNLKFAKHSSVSLNLTLDKNENVDYHIKENYKFIVLKC